MKGFIMVIEKVYVKKFKNSEYEYFDYLDTDIMYAYYNNGEHIDVSLCYDLMFYRNLYDINNTIEVSYALI